MPHTHDVYFAQTS